MLVFRALSALLTVVLLAAAIAPAFASPDAPTTPTTRRLDPGTHRFVWSLPLAKDASDRCQATIDDAHHVKADGYRMYATNDADDPCRLHEEPTYARAPHRGTLQEPNGTFHRVYLFPVTTTLKLDPNQVMSGRLFIVAERASLLQPRLTLETVTRGTDGHETVRVVSEWTAQEPATGAAVTEDPNGTDLHVFDYVFGDAPKELDGTIRIGVNLTRGPGWVRASSVTEYRIGTYGEMQSYLDIPVREAVGNPYRAPTVACPDGATAPDLDSCPPPPPTPGGPETPVNGTPEPSPGPPPEPNVTLSPMPGPAANAEGPPSSPTDPPRPKERGLPTMGLAPVLAVFLALVAVARRVGGTR